jgi:hypothetical protein
MKMVDFDKTYIDMCETSFQLQKFKIDNGLKIFDIGDYYYEKTKEEVVLVTKELKLLEKDSLTLIWLPTMDELNELISYSQFMININTISDHYNKNANYLCCINENNGKMVLLARFMQMKYKLMWQRGKWIKIEY